MFSDDPNKWVLPAYRIPLDRDQAFLLGSFTAIWAQIDYFMGLCIAALWKVDFPAADERTRKMTTGPRLDLFRKLAMKEIKTPSIKLAAKQFSDDLRPLIEKRNHMMHGMWGVVMRDKKIVGAGALHPKGPGPLLASELPGLIQAAAIQSHRIVTVATRLTNITWQYDPVNPPWFVIADTATIDTLKRRSSNA